MRPAGQVHGQAAWGLEHDGAAFAANEDVARIGADGERRTEAALNALARRPGGPTVLHDVAIPGLRANIDHVLVAGTTVHLIDSKVWRAGRYRTTPEGAVTCDGQVVPWAAKRTMLTAATNVRGYLAKHLPQVGTTVPEVGTLLVWPSSTARLTLRGVTVPGARAVPAVKGLRALRRRRFRVSADPRVVDALLALVASERSEREAARAASRADQQADAATRAFVASTAATADEAANLDDLY